MRTLAAGVMVWLALVGGAAPAPVAGEPVTVFAAASLSNALEEIGLRYRQATGTGVRFSFAASSTLARQIEAGAPAQIYFGASRDWAAYLDARDLLEMAPRADPISNRLVLAVPRGSPHVGVDLDVLPRLLGPGERIAIGDPAHVPAGIYARQALEGLGLWAPLEPRLALADNVRAALALVERGEAPFAVVYASDAAISGKVAVAATFPADSHAPIRYPLAIVKGHGSAEVKALYDFIISGEGLATFERHGFTGS